MNVPGLQHGKLLSITPPAAIVDNASFVTNVVDTLGYRFLTFLIYLGATDIALTVVKVQEADAASDATTLTSGADVTGTRVGTDTDAYGAASALPGATDDNKLVKVRIDLRGRKRYQKPVVTMGDGSAGGFVAVLAFLEQGEVAPDSATDEGCLLVMKA